MTRALEKIQGRGAGQQVFTPMMITETVNVRDLPQAWRDEADRLSRWPGNDGTVAALRLAAKELEHALQCGEEERLSLEAAARESGYSAEHLARLVRAGAIPNAGRKHAPGIRRRDLPRKPAAVAGVAAGQLQSDAQGRLFRDIITSKMRV